jgi:hypothetical protein
MVGGWRKLHIDELNNLYSSLNIFRMITSRRVGRACSMLRNKMSACRCLVGKPE